MLSLSKITFFAVLFGWCCASIPAQTKEDAALFHAYFEDSIRYKVDYFGYCTLYGNALTDPYGYGILDQEYVAGPARPMTPNTPGTWSGDGNWQRYGPNVSKVPCGSRKMMKNLIRETMRNMRERLYLGLSKENDKARMKRLLKDFRGKATTLPDFYKVIDKKYRGSVEAYVDHLFAHSMMTDDAKWKEFVKKPTRRKMRNDPAYLYTLSLMRYKGPILMQHIDSLPL